MIYIHDFLYIFFEVNKLHKLGSASHRRKFPWLRFDFEKDYVIYEIELMVRSDCCGMYILTMQATM